MRCTTVVFSKPPSNSPSRRMTSCRTYPSWVVMACTRSASRRTPGASPQDYALTAYDAVLVLDDTIRRLVTDGMPITRDNVRDYAQQTSLPTLQGTISFDDNGDLKEKIISVFQVKDGKYKYVGV